MYEYVQLFRSKLTEQQCEGVWAVKIGDQSVVKIDVLCVETSEKRTEASSFGVTSCDSSCIQKG